MTCFSLTSLLLVAEEAAAAAETAESSGLLNMDRLPLLGVAVFFVVAVVFWIRWPVRAAKSKSARSPD